MEGRSRKRGQQACSVGGQPSPSMQPQDGGGKLHSREWLRPRDAHAPGVGTHGCSRVGTDYQADIPLFVPPVGRGHGVGRGYGAGGGGQGV